MKGRIAGMLFAVVLALPAAAQEAVWVQIEARQTLSGAQDQARAYAQRLQDVSGFALGGGWYGIALGPYSSDIAQDVLSALRAEGAIPPDSYIVDGDSYGQQFWPIGIGAARAPQPIPGPLPAPESAALSPQAPAETPAEAPAEAPPAAAPDETLTEARQSEALLTYEERAELQIALEWAGHYQGSIDAAFGAGTRGAMRDWQISRGHEPTGVLTTREREELLADYNAVLKGLDLQIVRNEAAGIEITLPTGIIAFSDYDPPFAKYEPSDKDLPVQVLLISQPGDQDRLFGLYEIMQTLEIVPLEGPRQRAGNSFTLEGVDDEIHSYTFASLENGEIKGFTLIWPRGDEERRTRVLDQMRASFTPIPGVLDPGADRFDQAIDMVSGLQVRKPRLSRSGFYIDARGSVLTASETVQECERITIDAAHEAQVAYRDPDLGIAVLRPEEVLAPLAVARFQTGAPRRQAEVAIAGFPYGGALAAPAMTFGTLADLRGLGGEEDLARLALAAQPGDAGGPLFDRGGAVLGMVLPPLQEGGRILPPDVSFATDARAILAALGQAGIEAQTTDASDSLAPETLTLRAADMTVLVSCW